MGMVRTGIGKTKRDLLEKIKKLTLLVAAKTKNGEFSAKDKVVFKAAIVKMTLAYKLLDKVDCVQDEMSIPFGHYDPSGRRGAKKARRRR